MGVETVKINGSRHMHDGAIHVRDSCDLTVEKVKTGRYSHICDKLTGLKVLSDDFTSNGKCNLYLTPQPLLSRSYGLIFQVRTEFI